MKQLTAARLRELLHYDPETGVFTRRVSLSNRVKVGDVAGYVSEGYVLVCADGTKYRAHRLAWLYMTGEWPNEEIDHINRTTSDNRFANLREATTSENATNRVSQKNNTSGFKGVFWNSQRQKWQARIQKNKKPYHLGFFVTAKEASASYRKAALAIHGKFARIE